MDVAESLKVVVKEAEDVPLCDLYGLRVGSHNPHGDDCS